MKEKAKGSTLLAHTGLCEGLEHLKIETRLINERMVSVMGECVIRSYRCPIDVQCYLQCCSLVDNFADLRLDL